jgi:hypothetical protein
VNNDIFEGELEAVAALGVVPPTGPAGVDR